MYVEWNFMLQTFNTQINMGSAKIYVKAKCSYSSEDMEYTFLQIRLDSGNRKWAQLG